MDEAPWKDALQHRSSAREKILEHRFLADLLAEFWRRAWFQFGVARGEVDDGGYDLVVELGPITRHIQLKAKHEAGRAAHYAVNTALADRPSGCVVVIIHTLVSLEITRFHLLAGPPGQPVPDLGEALPRKPKGNAIGYKALKRWHRKVALSRFEQIATMSQLVDQLFGPQSPAALDIPSARL